MVTIFAIPNGVVVQLVRIHACHAWGRGFESRPFRFLSTKIIKNPSNGII